MRSLLKPTIGANTAAALVFATVLCMGLAPLWAGKPSESGEETKNESVAPSSGKGEGVVNVPSMPEADTGQTGEFGANGCRVVTTLTLTSGGIVLQLPAAAPTAMASYLFQGVLVMTTVQEGLVHFDASSLEAMRAEDIQQVDIILSAADGRFVRARLELPPNSDLVTVRIE